MHWIDVSIMAFYIVGMAVVGMLEPVSGETVSGSDRGDSHIPAVV